MSPFRVRRLSSAETGVAIPALADILLDVVDGGASVGFMAPLGREKAEGYWRRVAEGVAQNKRALLIAEDAATGEALGTAQVQGLSGAALAGLSTANIGELSTNDLHGLNGLVPGAFQRRQE